MSADSSPSLSAHAPVHGSAHGSTPRAPYAGPERRHHRVYVTRNTEYHVRDSRCVAVRDRRTGGFMDGHLAIHRRIEGGIRFFPNGSIAPNPEGPRQGESIYFAGGGRDLVTSTLESVERPSRETIDRYPAAQK